MVSHVGVIMTCDSVTYVIAILDELPLKNLTLSHQILQNIANIEEVFNNISGLDGQTAVEPRTAHPLIFFRCSMVEGYCQRVALILPITISIE